MRLRLAFKLHGEEAELARQMADAAGIEPDKIAKLAMQRYMQDVMDRAYAYQKEMEKNNVSGQSSNPDSVNSSGVVPSPSDALPSQTPG